MRRSNGGGRALLAPLARGGGAQGLPLPAFGCRPSLPHLPLELAAAGAAAGGSSGRGPALGGPGSIVF